MNLIRSLRAHEFKKVSPKDKNELKKHEQLGAKISKKFYNNYKKHCKNHMLEVEDLRSYVRVWTYTFLGMYPNKPIEDNGGLFYCFIKQRFSTLAQSIKAPASIRI